MLVGTTVNDVERCTGRQTVAASEFSSFDQTIQVSIGALTPVLLLSNDREQAENEYEHRNDIVQPRLEEERETVPVLRQLLLVEMRDVVMLPVDGDALIGQNIALKEALFEVADAFFLRENVQTRIRVAVRCRGQKRFVQMAVEVAQRA